MSGWLDEEGEKSEQISNISSLIIGEFLSTD